MTLSELKALEAKTGRKIIVIGPNVWGCGKTGKVAYKNASQPKQWIAFDCHEKTWVSTFDGSLQIDGEDNPDNLPSDQIFVELGRSVSLKK